MVSSYHLSQSTNFSHEYDEDYHLARQLERKEKELRRREEENNRRAMVELLHKEEKEARWRRQSQLAENQKATLESQQQEWKLNRDHQKHSWQNNDQPSSSFVSYSILLQEHQEQEESLRVAQQLQAEEEEGQRRQQMKQEFDDERMAVRLMLGAAVAEEASTAATTKQQSQYESHQSLTPAQKDDVKAALRMQKEAKTKMVVTRMFKEHAKFERKARRNGSMKRLMLSRDAGAGTSITSPSLLYSRS